MFSLEFVPLLAAIGDLWYALELIVIVSLVYSATRYERMKPIFLNAARFGFSVVVFMAVTYAVLYWLTKPL